MQRTGRGHEVNPPRRPSLGRFSRRWPWPDPRNGRGRAAAARASGMAKPPFTGGGAGAGGSGGSSGPASPPPHLNLYDVLMDADHPAFEDLGRLLWTMIATQSSWVDRRVETASLTAERRFRRHMSVDCRVPPSVLDLVLALGFTRFLVPLRFVTKQGPLLAFDLRLDDQSVPWLTRPQNAMAARSVLYAAIDQLGQPLTPELDAALHDVAGTDSAAADRALELLGLTDGGRLGHQATPEQLVCWLVNTLDRNFLLLADVAVQQVRRRTVFKITQELGLRVQEPLPLRSQVAWEPTSFVFDTPDVTAASSYHFQFVAPDGMVIAGGELYGAPADSETGSPVSVEVPAAGAAGRSGHQPFGISAGQGSVLGLNTHVGDVPEAETYNVEVLVRPSPDGLLRACAVSSAFSTVLLFLATAFSPRLDSGRLDASIALLLVLPGVVSTLLARPGEHHLVSRLLRGVRTLTLANAVTLYLAAAVIVAGVAGSALRIWWLGLAVVSAIPSVVLGIAVRRCRPHRWQ